MNRKVSLLITVIFLCFSLAGCTNTPPATGVQTNTAFSVTADDFMTQFIGLTMREPVFAGDVNSELNSNGKVKTYTFDDTIHSGVSYTIALDYQADSGILTAVTLSSQLIEKADQSGYSANPFFGVYAREAIRILEETADFSAINENCNFTGTADADSTYQTNVLSIRTVIAGDTITASVTAL